MSLRRATAIVHPVIHVIWMGDSLVLLPRSSLQSAHASKKQTRFFSERFRTRPILLFQKMRGWLSFRRCIRVCNVGGCRVELAWSPLLRRAFTKIADKSFGRFAERLGSVVWRKNPCNPAVG